MLPQLGLLRTGLDMVNMLLACWPGLVWPNMLDMLDMARLAAMAAGVKA